MPHIVDCEFGHLIGPDDALSDCAFCDRPIVIGDPARQRIVFDGVVPVSFETAHADCCRGRGPDWEETNL